MATYMADGGTTQKLIDAKKKAAPVKVTTPVPKAMGSVTPAKVLQTAPAYDPNATLIMPTFIPKSATLPKLPTLTVGGTNTNLVKSPAVLPTIPKVGNTMLPSVTPPATTGKYMGPTTPAPPVTDVKTNQGSTGTVGSNPAKPATPQAVQPVASQTTPQNTSVTLYDFANDNGLDLKWVDGQVSLNGVPLSRDQLESSGGRLVNGRWTFNDTNAITNLVGASITNPTTQAPVAGAPQNDVVAMMRQAADEILAGYQAQLQGIGTQLGALNINDYVNKAWETLKPMYEYQQNELKGTSEASRVANEAGQEARGLGASGLYKADNMTEDKALLNGMNQLFAETNAQALDTGESLMGAERNRLADMYQLTAANYNASMDVLSMKLDDYYKGEGLALDKQKIVWDVLDSNRQFELDNKQLNQNILMDNAQMTESKRMNDHAIEMDNWNKSFQERNAARVSTASSTANKKAPWGTDDYDDNMFITRTALIEMLYDPAETPNNLALAWQQATLEFPELAQDTALYELYQDAAKTKPIGPTIEEEKEIIKTREPYIQMKDR